MKKIDREILIINQAISKNIEIFDDSNRGLLSQNILGQLRNLVEHTSLKAYSNNQKQDFEVTYENLQKGNNFVKTKGNLKFLSKFHKLLQITASHYTKSEENSERLMLKYFEYLLKIKLYLKDIFNLDVLENIDKFPLNLDTSTKEYYEKIAQKINRYRNPSSINDKFYIQKIKPFFVDFQVYYEVTFTRANDFVSKFDRIIAFTKLDISDYYAVKLFIQEEKVNILDKNMPILIIDKWEVSIRPCELNNFGWIFVTQEDINSGHKEYQNLMRFLTHTGMSLVNLVLSSDSYYSGVKKFVQDGANTNRIFNILDRCKELIIKKSSGSNIVRYLLHNLNNKIIKNQRDGECYLLSDLRLNFGCIPFDQMPFATSPIQHIPKISNLLECLDSTNREHEFFSRRVQTNTENKGQLYTHKDEVSNFKDIDNLIKKFNGTLYKKTARQRDRKILIYKDFFYIKNYEDNVKEVIESLQDLSSSGLKNYSKSVESWLETYTATDIDNDKKEALAQMFGKSKVALIYGSAGTGKSTMVNHISNFFNDKTKLYLANTNPAVNNLKRKVRAQKCEFMTIAKFTNSNRVETEFDILMIDECSTVSNSDMLNVLKKATFKLLVLVGDTYQIESIRFGNWFDIAKGFIPKTSIFELTIPYRSTKKELINLWNKVRHMEESILEQNVVNNYSEKLNETIFDHSEEDQIILCLNYDGLYGINNINKFLQSNNPNQAIPWGNLTYKIDDPILFNDTKRFGTSIYNNLKGKIVSILILGNSIQFDIEIFEILNEMNEDGFELIGNSESGNSIIRFSVGKQTSSDHDDDTTDDLMPFQVAYAVSIHKAQGLEYDSVKIVVSDEVEEMITHNIFYTAITRAKEKLKIYWSPETEKKVLENLKPRNNSRDTGLLKSKM